MNRTNHFGIFVCCCFLASFLLISETAFSRTMVGMFNNQPVRLQTQILQNGEYFRASDLIPFFSPNRWEYDGLSGTLRITRQDGTQVGVKVGNLRVVAGNQVFLVGKPLIREQNRVFIPFQTVVQFLLPDANLQEEGSQVPLSDLATQPTLNPLVTPSPSQDITFPQDVNDILSTPTPIPSPEPQPTKVNVPQAIVLIDPGMGSQNVNAGIREADITIAIANKLSTLLTESPNYEVLLTQNNSKQAPLSPEQRTTIANQSKANLFISIQCGNLFTENVSRGVVYYMNPVLDASDIQGDPSSPATSQSSRWDDAYRTNVDRSIQFAREINLRLQQFYASASIISIDSEPRPGRLAVLRGLVMPGILVELGNLMNRDTAQYLSRTRVQDDLAYELYQAINDFLHLQIGTQNTIPSQTRP